MTYRFKQCVNAIVFKYFNEQIPNYLNEVFHIAREDNFQWRGSFQKLECPFRKTNTGQLLCHILVQRLRTKPQTGSSVLRILIPSNII